jgi:hypothetical protein
VLLWILGIFTTAVRLAAYVVLLAQAARMHGPEPGELLLQALDLAFDGGVLHIRYHYSDIGYCQALSLKIRNFLVFFLSPGDCHLAAAATGGTIPPCL